MPKFRVLRKEGQEWFVVHGFCLNKEAADVKAKKHRKETGDKVKVVGEIAFDRLFK
jgi:hypothetical protein